MLLNLKLNKRKVKKRSLIMKSMFIRRLIGFSIGPVAGAIISFITIPLTTYFIEPAEFGKASMFSVFQVLISTFLFLGLDQAYTREYFEIKDKINLLKNALLLPLISSFVILLMIVFNLNFVSKILFNTEHYKFASFLFGYTIILMVIERFILLSIRMEEKALEYSIVNIFIKISILICTLIFVLFIRTDFLAVIYSTVLGQIIGNLYLVIKYRSYINYFSFTLDKRLIKRLLIFGIPLIFSASIITLLQSLDRIFLRAWSTFEEIGIFTAALKISAVLTVIQTAFTSFWVPTAYRWYKEKKDIKHFQLVSNALLLFMSILFMILLMSKKYISMILSSDYSSAAFIIGMLCLQPIMYTISETTTLGIVFSRKSYLNIYVSVIAIIPNVAINILLVPKFGSIGAAIATGVAYIFFFLSRSILSNRYWKGMSIKLHLIVSLVMFIAALINAYNFEMIIMVNLLFLTVILLIQISTIRNLYNILFKTEVNKSWDFS